MKIDTLMNVLEVLIMVSDTPLTTAKLCELVDHQDVSIKEVKEALQELSNVYEGRGIALKKVASGYRFQAKEEYQQWFHKLFSEKPAKYSRALLETLAILAYRQPVTRADVESIRGVAVSTSIMRTLLERDWIKVVGHRDVPGKPSIYATTKAFLDYFNIARLDDLPPLSEVKELADIMEKGKASEVSLKEAMEEKQQVLPLEEDTLTEELDVIAENNQEQTEPLSEGDEGSKDIEVHASIDDVEALYDAEPVEDIEVAAAIDREENLSEVMALEQTESATQETLQETVQENEPTFAEKMIEEVTEPAEALPEKEEEVI